jgi:hypothetical protein
MKEKAAFILLSGPVSVTQRRRTMNARRTICAAFIGLMMIGITGAEETKLSVAAKDVFRVYGGSCRRSLQLLGTYENIDKACRAAEKFRDSKNNRQVEVVVNAREVFPVGERPVAYRIYRNPCKGFFLVNTVTNAEKVNDIVEPLKKNGDLVEIVPVYAKK